MWGPCVVGRFMWGPCVVRRFMWDPCVADKKISCSFKYISFLTNSERTDVLKHHFIIQLCPEASFYNSERTDVLKHHFIIQQCPEASFYYSATQQCHIIRNC
jgi:hypothetical protein